VEAQPAFEGAQGAVELHPEAAVDAQPAGVVLPGDAEENLAFRLDDAFEDLRVAVVAVAVEHGRERFEHLARGLEELRLAGIAARHLFQDFGDIGVHGIYRSAAVKVATTGRWSEPTPQLGRVRT